MTKINFINDHPPAISAENLNQLQDNIEDAIETDGGKIDKIKVQGVEQEIVDKEVDLDVPTMEQICDLMPNGTATGEIIHITDSSNLKAEVKGYGNTKQITTTGKQLLDKSQPETYKSSTYFIELDTGVRAILDTSGASKYACYSLMDLTNYVGKTVRMKANYVASSNNEGKYMIGLCNQKATSRLAQAQSTASGQTISFVVPELTDKTFLCVWFYSNAKTTFSDEDDYVDYTDVIVTIDNSDMSYEPYTGGIASPNPQYPQEIEVITGSVTEKIVGKNLYKIMAKTDRGISATYNENTGVLSYNGTPTGSYADITEAFYINLPSGNLNVKIDNPQSSVGVQIRGRYIDGTTTEARINPGSLSVTLPVTKQLYELKMFLVNLTSGTAVSGSFKFMVSKDGGEIEKYQENTSIINLQGNEMVKLSDTVKDELNVDINGNVKLIKNIGKVALSRFSQKHPTITSENKGFYRFVITDKDISHADGTTGMVLSDYFINVGRSAQVAFNNNDSGIWWEGASTSCYVILEKTSLAEANAWLEANPTTLYYLLATPQVIDLGKVTPLHTYKNVSNISALTNIPTNMEIKYKKDIESVLNELATAIVSQ